MEQRIILNQLSQFALVNKSDSIFFARSTWFKMTHLLQSS